MADVAKLGIVVNFEDVKKAKDAVKELASTGKQAESSAKGLQGAVKGIGDASKQASQGVKSLSDSVKSLGALKSTVVGVTAAITGLMAVSQLGTKFIEVNRSAQVMGASLKTVTGSVEAAGKAMKMLEEFAAETPFSLKQAVDGFVKLKALGLDPSRESLISYGNTASAMGKDLNQMVEAVADATTGEFERLKEFGIKSSKEGDKVKFTFQGVTTTVRDNTKEIEAYLRKIGDVNFAGAMAERAKTIDGAISNMGASFDGFLTKLGQTGIIDGVTLAIRGLTSGLDFLANNVNVIAGVMAGAFTAGLISLSGVVLPAVATGIGIVTTAIKAMTVAMLTNPITAAITAIAVGVGVAVTAFLNFKDALTQVVGRAVTVGETWNVVWNGIKQTVSVTVEEVGKSLNSIVEYASGVANAVSDVFSGIGRFINNVFDGALDYIKDTFPETTEFLSSTWNSVMTTLSETADSTWTTVTSAWSSAVDNIVSLASWAWENVQGGLDTLMEWFGYAAGKADEFGGYVAGVWNSIAGSFAPVVNWIQGAWDATIGKMINKAVELKNWLNKVWGESAVPVDGVTAALSKPIQAPSLGRISSTMANAFDPKIQGVQFKPTEKPAANSNTKPGNTGAGDDKGGKGNKGGKSEAEKAIDEQKRLADSYRDKIAAMKEDAALGQLKLNNVGLEASAIEKLVMMNELEVQAKKAKLTLTPAEISANQKLIDQIVDQKSQFEKMNDLRQKSKSIIEDLKSAEEDRAEKLKEASDMLAEKYLNEEQYMRRLIDINEEYTQAKIDSAERIKQKEEEKLNSSKRFEDGVTRGFNQLKAESEDYAKQGETMVTGSINGMADAMAEFATTGKLNFADLAKSMIKEMIRIAVIRAALNLFGMFAGIPPGAMTPATGTTTATMGGFGGAPTMPVTSVPLASANGNAFQGGRLIPFAKGGVFDKPAAFPLADGKTGIAFEAGPEAIMPLRRGPDGKLGVVASGTNSNTSAPIVVNLDITYNASSGTSSDQAAKDAQQLGMMIEAKVVQVMDKYQRSANARGRMAG